MMWHWNSLWAPAPGDPPAVDDPALWRTPWSAEQAIALQARGWETLLSATHSWWSMVLSAWPATPGWPAFPAPGFDRAAIAGAEPLALKPPTEADTTPPPRKAAVRKRTSVARKR